jgi:2-dehydropantoate 2-reductase
MGAGGLGGYFGGLLARAGHRVTFVARGAHLEALQRQRGMRVMTAQGEVFAPGTATADPGAGPHADLVLFAVKSFDTEDAARAIRPVVAEETAILSVQNGVNNEEVLARAHGSERVLGGNVYLLATIKEPGLIAWGGGPGLLNFGEWRGGPSDRVTRLEAAMQAAGINATAVDDVVREKWVKYALICAQAGMTALTRLPIGEIRTSPPAWAMYRRILEEVVAVGRARGVRLDARRVVEEHLALAARLQPDYTSSMHYDLTHGKRLEVEALHGTAVRYGREAGVPTPACEAVYAALLPHDRLAQVRAGRGEVTPSGVPAAAQE